MVSETKLAGAPNLPFGLAVGITGHRADAAGRETIAAAAPAIAAVLAEFARAAAEVRAANTRYFAEAPSELRLVSPLADGADQLAARLALDQGYSLEAILPFPAEVYATDFADAADAAAFADLSARASATLELPGDRANALDAYVNAGRAVIAHADVVIALWDGEPARGRGGTAEIVEHALRRGLPVVHVHTEAARPPRILWSSYDEPPLDVLDFCDAPHKPFVASEVDALVTALLAPPAAAVERGFITTFVEERERLTRARIEYPLLLAVIGVRPIRRSHVRVAPYQATVAAEWRAFHGGCEGAGQGVAGGFRSLEEAYCWADKLAEHYAVAYRSGHVLNFVLAALATMIALGGRMLPQLKYPLVGFELATILLFIVNTHVGVKRGWHRRWLDYRYLAEQLRPMRSLKLFALARPSTGRQRGARRWVDWYAGGFWRTMGCAHGRLDPATLDTLGRLVVQEELQPQLDYHRANSSRMHHVEQRLRNVANLFFLITIASLFVELAGWLMFHSERAFIADTLTVITAGLPALAAALHGIREQGDFARTSTRSSATAGALSKLAVDLSVRPIALTRAASLTEEAARVMLDDVGEWRMSYEMRNLTLPA